MKQETPLSDQKNPCPLGRGEVNSSLPLSSATVVVSTLPSLKSNTAIRHGLQAAGFQGHFIATAHDEAERAAELIVDDLRTLRTQLQ